VISRSWHLFIPPLLTILDDGTTPIRVSGLVLLSELLQKTPSRMLEQTGLGDVFEEAVLPTLLFLPSLTPVNESLLLLEEAYKALFILSDLRFGAKKDQSNRNKLLDRILRQGVFHGLDHCRENVRITELLLQEMGDVIDRAGIYSIKHLKVHMSTKSPETMLILARI
jgi:tRNA nucleotidyltransferase (CCA-adding enzyme)